MVYWSNRVFHCVIHCSVFTYKTDQCHCHCQSKVSAEAVSKHPPTVYYHTNYNHKVQRHHLIYFRQTMYPVSSLSPTRWPFMTYLHSCLCKLWFIYACSILKSEYYKRSSITKQHYHKEAVQFMTKAISKTNIHNQRENMPSSTQSPNKSWQSERYFTLPSPNGEASSQLLLFSAALPAIK